MLLGLIGSVLAGLRYEMLNSRDCRLVETPIYSSEGSSVMVVGWSIVEPDCRTEILTLVVLGT